VVGLAGEGVWRLASEIGTENRLRLIQLEVDFPLRLGWGQWPAVLCRPLGGWLGESQERVEARRFTWPYRREAVHSTFGPFRSS
jgi:hypothetical protein